MSFFAILIALILEQVRPLSASSLPQTGMTGWARWVQRNFDAGQPRHGGLAWTLAAGLPAAATALVFVLLKRWTGWPAAMLWSIAVLYMTVGFRQFSHHFTGIRDALVSGQEQQARQLLAQWQQFDASQLPRSQIVRYLIEGSVIAAHRHVFGVLAWFSLLAALGLGPAGAVLYRAALVLQQRWQQKPAAIKPGASPALQRTASRAWYAIDWLPARLTAIGFAVVGNFEEAIDRWRSHAQQFPEDNDGVILAATSGALNVQWGQTGDPDARTAASAPEAPEQAGAAPPGEADASQSHVPMAAHLAHAVALVWRSVVMWMALLALLTLSNLLG